MQFFVFVQGYLNRSRMIDHVKYVEARLLHKEFLNFLLDCGDLRLDLRSFVLGDRGGNHWAGHTAGAAQSLFGPRIEIRVIKLLHRNCLIQSRFNQQSIKAAKGKPRIERTLDYYYVND